MIFLREVLLESFTQMDDLRIEGLASLLAPEIYLCFETEKRCFPLHRSKWESHSRIFLKGWPDAECWKEIFNLYGIHDEYIFCMYIHHISRISLLKENPGYIVPVLKSFGYSSHRFQEIIYIASLQGYKRQLFLEKKIPVKILRLLDQTNDSLNESFCKYILIKQVNGNIAREMISHWLDLNNEQKNQIIDIFTIASQNSSEMNFSLAEEFRTYLQRVRFPDLNLRQSEFEHLQKKLPPYLSVEYDPTFENNQLKVLATVEDLNQLKTLVNSFYDNHNIIILEQLVNLLNQT